jgi:hypothetical protein
MRRHYAPYFAGLPHIKPFRSRLVTSENPAELFDILNEIEVHYSGTENTATVGTPKIVYEGLDA